MHDVLRAILMVAGVLLLAPEPVHAYIDPLSGSIIFQVIAAAVLGASLTARRFWRRVLGVFTRSSRAEDDVRKG